MRSFAESALDIRGRAALSVAAAIDLLLPVACVACDGLLGSRDRGIICGLCWSRLPTLPAPVCRRCGHPLTTGTCRWCELLPAFVRAVRSVCWLPAEPASAIVHALKYDGWAAAATGMAERMARLSWPLDVMEERAALIPVPLSSARERQRGYNQSNLLAVELAKKWKLPVWNDVVIRTRDTRSQTELTPEQRLGNVAGSFRAGSGTARIAGTHLVIIDDVVTTAATLNACAKVLYDAGARIISYVTFGRARASGDRL